MLKIPEKYKDELQKLKDAYEAECKGLHLVGEPSNPWNDAFDNFFNELSKEEDLKIILKVIKASTIDYSLIPNFTRQPNFKSIFTKYHEQIEELYINDQLSAIME